MAVEDGLRAMLVRSQRNEITEHHVYGKLADLAKGDRNRKVLKDISQEELEHYRFWKRYSGQEVSPDLWKVRRYLLLARLFGITFAIKLMERGEEAVQEGYSLLVDNIPEARSVLEDEERHEAELVEMIDEERLRYVGSIVLGLNDALVELTGALAGYTLAFRDSGLVAMAGLITGIAAALSMGASEYLSTRTEEGAQDPKKASLYTGSTYLVTVFLLITPFLVLDDILVSLATALVTGVLIILAFTYYISVAKDLPFRRRFAEMAGISLGVAAVSFFIGFLVRMFFNLEV